MFLLFYDWLKDVIPGANVLRYVSFRILMATLTTLVTSMVLLPEFIRRLREKKLGQSIREVGPKTHQVKAGTPTMGGTVILIAAAVSILLWADLRNPMILMLLFILLSFGAVGFVDDYLKLKYANSKGLPGRYKLLFQFLSAGLVMAVFLTWYDARFGFDHRLYIPFLRSDRYWIELPEWLYFLFALVVIVGTSNAVNLTDGLDGLAIGCTGSVALAYAAMAYVAGNAVLARYLAVPHIPGTGELAVFCGCLLGASLGFLWYNCHPAQVFMGDTGSLALGGAIAMVALLVKQELALVIVGGVFVLEAVSVILQVGSFKLRGKRIFAMAPLHHHFELKKWSETQVTIRFWILSIIFALLGVATLKIR